jgi:hypothetical protein
MDEFQEVRDDVDFYIWWIENEDLLWEEYNTSGARDELDYTYDDFLEDQYEKYSKNHPRDRVEGNNE